MIVKKIQMDRMKESDARDVIRWEAEQHVPRITSYNVCYTKLLRFQYALLVVLVIGLFALVGQFLLQGDRAVGMRLGNGVCHTSRATTDIYNRYPRLKTEMLLV